MTKLVYGFACSQGASGALAVLMTKLVYGFAAHRGLAARWRC